MRYFLFFLVWCFLGSGALVSAQDRKLLPDTVIIDRDTLVMLGDSLLIQAPVKETFWKTGGNYTLNIQQVTLSNWAAGGTGSFALNSGVALFANFKKDSKVWDTQLTVNLGFNRQNDRAYTTRKTNDNFIFVSNYGRQLADELFLTTQIDARTQLVAGFRYARPGGTDTEVRTKISDLLSPGYLQSSTGLNFRKTYEDKSRLSVILSPFTGRFTLVMNDSLSSVGAFGVVPGEKVRAEAGMSVAVGGVDVVLLENVTWKADLNLFSNYERFGNLVVNFNSLVRMKVNKFISTRIETVLIYDEEVLIKQDDGRSKQALQLQNLINFGISLDF
jgi:hypothetical protein